MATANHPAPGGGEAPPRTARELLARGRAYLLRQGIAEARLDAELLVAHALGLERLQLFLDLDRPVTHSEVGRARQLLLERAAHRPVAYLLGAREFYGRSFAVGPAVLVPRPETELLVDLARKFAKERLFPGGGPRVLDVGTGSGCLAVTLALELEGSRVSAADVSAAALEVARANGDRLGASVAWWELDVLAALSGSLGPFPWEQDGPMDLVVSNPPYVDRSQREALPPEVREHEPELALFAPDGAPDRWATGLALVLAPRLAPGGLLLVELGYDQAPRLRSFFGQRGFGEDGRSPKGFALEFARDLAGVERVMCLWAPA